VKIVVLGAGVVGVAAAWYLAEAGHEVTVVDRQAGAGLETSFANGGQISAGHAEPWAQPAVLPKVLRWIGREDAPLLFRLRADPAQWEWGLRFAVECLPWRFTRNCRALAGLAAYSRNCLRELRQRTGLQYDQLERGILHIATNAADFERLARHAQAVRSLGIEREVLDGAACVKLEPALAHSTDRVAGGAYTRQDESGDAHRFTRELARLAAGRGVEFRFGCRVDGLECNTDAVLGIVVEGKVLSADACVVALGSYSPLLLAPLGVHVPVYPLKGYSITLPLGPAEQGAAPSVSLTDEAHKIVISRLGNRLRAAGTAELTGYDTSINTTRCAAILRRIRQLFPQLGAVTTAENWAGLRPATPGNVPVIGRTRYKNLFLDTGHGTLGWRLACGSGRALADLISGRKPEVEFPFHA